MSAAADDMRSGMDGVQRTVNQVSGYLDPLRVWYRGREAAQTALEMARVMRALPGS